MTFGKTLGAAAIGAAVLATAFGGVASAQTYRGAPYQGGAYDVQGGYYYDGCRRAENNRSVGGGLAGAIAGAVIGGNVASRNARDEGAVLGGVLGAVVGSQIGKSTAACQPTTRRYDDAYAYDSYGYDQRTYAPVYEDRYDDRYSSGYGYQPDPYAYDRRAPRGSYEVAPSAVYDRDGCTMAESPIYLPDGRTQTRLVRVCRDSRGRYQVVD